MTQSVGIRELKNNLSKYVRQVRSGATIMVLDRGEVVGELRKAQAKPAAKRRRAKCPPSPLRLAEGTAQRLLDELRGE
jgi:antitoxin (DNA-binding transcriptional repressor) of toxin-antitoxin stability system